MSDLLKNLAPPDPRWLTGAIEREPRPQDWQLLNRPEVRAALAEGLPASFLVLPIDSVKLIYNQIGPSCVAYSECTSKSIEDFLDLGRWPEYDGLELYHASGGDDVHGIYTDLSLARVRDVGCLEIASGARRKIASYEFAPQMAGAWRQTLAAAMVATGPVVIATLLPETFGWDSRGLMTSGYHQMCAIGYEGLGDGDNVVFANTWSRSAGRNGFFRLSWEYLESGGGFQGNFVYGYKMVDVDDPDEPIPPDPNHQAFTAVVLKVKPGKLLLDPPAGLPSLAGRAVTVDGTAGKIKSNDEDVMIVKGQFDPEMKGRTVKIETL